MEFEARSLDDYYRRYHAHMTRPHRHSFYQILWFRNPGSHFIDFIEYRHDREAIFFIAKDHIHYFEEAPPVGMLLHFNTAYLGAALAAKESAFLFHLFDSFHRSPMVLPDSAELAEMTSLLKMIKEEYERPPANAGNDVIMCLLSALLVLGHRCKTQSEEPHHADDKREAVLVPRVQVASGAGLRQGASGVSLRGPPGRESPDAFRGLPQQHRRLGQDVDLGTGRFSRQSGCCATPKCPSRRSPPRSATTIRCTSAAPSSNPWVHHRGPSARVCRAELPHPFCSYLAEWARHAA